MVTEFNYGKSKGFELKNEFLTARFISYGARITELHYEGKDVVLGFDTYEDFVESEIYSGAVVGRVGNRIAGGKFVLNGKEYNIPKNENNITTNHGGTMGFDRFEWDAEILSENAIRFSRLSPDGEMGFPGNLTVSLTYSLDGSALVLEYNASSDADTYINLTNHAYFNLDGFDGEDCLKMHLQFNAPWYLPIDKDLIPTGEIAPVDNTDFDFRTLRPIALDFDHCFVLAMDQNYRKAGTLYSPKSGIVMDIETDMPAMQFYTSARVDEKAGKGGIPLYTHQGVTMESQFFPDTPHNPHFPSTLLKKDEKFYSITRYIFSKK